MTSVMAVATRTVVRVCMLCSQSDRPTSRIRHAAAMPAERSPEMNQARANTAPITSHAGALVRMPSSGLRNP